MAPDVAAAEAYAHRRLAEELPAVLDYHALFHTESVVVPAARALGAAAGIDAWSQQLLVVAAWFHDIGYIEQYPANEPIAVRIVGEVLPGLGFSAEDVELIQGMIWATQLPQSPHSRLEELMADADLDALGRPDFWEIQHSLREEHEAHGHRAEGVDWLDEQIAFLGSHRYFTAEARARNDEAKARHLAGLVAARDAGTGR